MSECFACGSTKNLSVVRVKNKRITACSRHIAFAHKMAPVHGEDDGARPAPRSRLARGKRATSKQPLGLGRRWPPFRGRVTPGKMAKAAEALAGIASRRTDLPQDVEAAVRSLQGTAALLKRRMLDAEGVAAFNAAAATVAAHLNGGGE